MTRTWTTPVLSGCLAAACVCALASAPASGAPSCDTSWAGGDGDWGTAANWSNGVPTATTDACVVADGTYTVTVAGPAEAQGLTVGDGELDLDSSATLALGSLSIIGGTVAGSGTIDTPTVTNTGGVVHPDGTLTLTGDYSQDAASRLVADVAGGSFSQLGVSGAASLAGALDVTTTGVRSASFDVVGAGTRTGTFNTVSFTGQRHTVDYGASAVTLTPIQAPANTSPPKVFGTPEFGETLHCNEGGWTNSPSAYAYTWKRDGTPIVNANGVEYQASFLDVGHHVSCEVVALNPLASDPAESEGLLIPGGALPGGSRTGVVFTPAPDGFSPGFAGAPGSTTALTPASPVPVALRTARLEPGDGEVLVRLPGSGARVRVQAATAVPVGTLVDATHGIVRLAVPKDFEGGVQRGRFSRGSFYYRQALERIRARHKLFKALVTRLALVGGGSVKSCPAGSAGRLPAGPRGAIASAGRFTRILDAWGNGRVRVIGRLSSGRGNGARWVTRDDCSGTRTTVIRGAVVVTDFATRRSFVVTAGHHHLATG